MAVKEDVNEFVIEELRRVYDELCKDYSEATVKILAYLGGTLGFLAYLYSGHSLFLPKQAYGKIFYGAAIGTILLSVCYLLYAIRANEWTLPIERKKINKLDSSETRNRYLEHTKELYIEALDDNTVLHNRKQKALNFVTVPLVLSAMVLLVIKYFAH